MDAASIQRWWSLSSRWEHHKLGNSSPNVSVKSAECKAVSISQHWRRRAASCQMGQPAPATRNAGFLSGSVFSFFKGFKRMQVKATEMSLIHQDEETENEAGIFVSDLAPLSTLPQDSSNSSRLVEMGCCEEKMRSNGKVTRKRNSQGKEPRTCEGNSQGRDSKTPERNSRVPHRRRVKVGRKRKSASGGGTRKRTSQKWTNDQNSGKNRSECRGIWEQASPKEARQ